MREAGPKAGRKTERKTAAKRRIPAEARTKTKPASPTKITADPAAPTHFRPGDRVRVIAIHPPGHIRTPHYIRGKSGVIERSCGAFGNPEELAFGRTGRPRQPLYRVRFAQNHVWPDYRGPTTDTIDIEIYQHWLDPA
ncbi:MAG: nitrile hydratase subunit beta [Alphaproteobacteria bacterium]|nr:nitrile hydratase subunit beta [Alphaproteobacteria bacterium]